MKEPLFKDDDKMGEPTIDPTEDTNKPDTKEVDNE